LWDPHNLSSLYHVHTQRGKKISVRFGEQSGEATLWQDQGDFVVEDVQISYSRPHHPVATINCRDRRAQWYEGEVQMTDDYSGEFPETILSDLLTDHCNLVSGESFALPLSGEMSFSHPIYMRWMEQNIMDIFDELLDHFRYVHHYDVDGNFTIKEIDFNKDVDHVYPNTTKLVNYSPDNSYSIYTNRIVVKAEGRYEIPVIYGEELYGQDWGTLGWYGYDETERHYFSKDEKLRITSPRLSITRHPQIDSIFGGTSGRVTIEKTTETYMDVNVWCGDRTGTLIAALASMAVAAALAIACDATSWIPGGGSLCGIPLGILAGASILASEVLGTMGYYSYEIYGKPRGTYKQTFQQEANDFESQMMLDGMVITQEINDPLCYKETHCKFVAERSMELIKYQRYGVTCTKIADLRDELLDIITIPHPHSGQPFDYMIYSLTRRFMQPGGEEGGDGYFFDDIEGWNLSIIRTDISIDP
jgi:hypothetical protein